MKSRRVLLGNPLMISATMTCLNMRERCGYLWYRMTRRKTIESSDTTTALNRYLSTFHLTFMGVGATVGVGIYVLVGVAAKEYAGPGMLISFILAGIVTLMNALCFVEFGSRIPKTGGSYTYVYESMGEIMAFLVGWIILLGYLTSGAIGCRAWSGYFDSLFDGAIHNKTVDIFGTINLGPPFSHSLDLVAFCFELTVLFIVSLGIHASAKVNFVLSMVSISVLLFVTIMGFIFGNIENVINKDHGGFFPFGVKGVIVATSACFYAFQGFDVICLSAEESKTPLKSIPRAILFELIIVTLLYAGSSFSLIMLAPVYLIDTKAPIPSAFAVNNIQWAKYVVTIGPVLGISNLSLLNLYSTSRHAYCMANDGLFLKVFGVVHKKTQVPLVGVMSIGIFVALSSLFLDIADLVQFNVLGLFVINIIISSNIVILRSRTSDSSAVGDSERKTMASKCQISKIIDKFSVVFLIFVLVVISLMASLLIQRTPVLSSQPNITALCTVILFWLLIVAISFIIKLKLKPPTGNSFKVPFVPLLPVIIITTNMMLLVYAIDLDGLITFSVLILIGLVIYLVLIIFSRDVMPRETVISEEEVGLMSLEQES
ncbi:hypothetical protein SNE40_015345 [Patella caerulea]|uniref:Cationic amino acid transporter C-terminal domain-containing protein n=1 Tax=Patella caerulea TaxID=87958 RepID=A0AAN8PRX4_PATCE